MIRTFIALFCIIFSAFAINSAEHKAAEALHASEQMVWICTSESAYAYHCDSNCRGLSRCKCSVKKVSLAQAKKLGKNKACQICH